MIKKAIFPVGGLGTRFLPATKAMPKEMLPIVDKPLIQYAVEEAAAAGIEPGTPRITSFLKEFCLFCGVLKALRKPPLRSWLPCPFE